MPLDLTLLENVRHHPSGKITARCPACAEAGGDRKGNHLGIFPDESFGCAPNAGDEEHRRRIMALAGIRSDFRADPERRRAWRERQATERRRRIEAERLAGIARHHREELVERFEWSPADVWEDSPQRIDCALVAACPRHFLATLFPAEAILWTGEFHHTGKPEHATRWKHCADWLRTGDTVGPMTTPATWHPGTHSRSGNHVASAPFTVFDFDGFDGIKPRTPGELKEHLRASLALIRWFRDFLHWQLAAILHTGNKSLHAWFETPPPGTLASLRETAKPLGIDAGLVGRPEHSCRLPGQIHAGTGNRSRVLWLRLPAASGHHRQDTEPPGHPQPDD